MCVSCCVAPNRQGPHLTLKVCWGTRLGSKRSFCVCVDSELLMLSAACSVCHLHPLHNCTQQPRLTSSQKYEADSRSWQQHIRAKSAPRARVAALQNMQHMDVWVLGPLFPATVWIWQLCADPWADAHQLHLGQLAAALERDSGRTGPAFCQPWSWQAGGLVAGGVNVLSQTVQI